MTKNKGLEYCLGSMGELAKAPRLLSSLGGELEVTISYNTDPIKLNFRRQIITTHYPLPSGLRHPGGRLQRKARLRKKQMKYRFESGYSFRGFGHISDQRTEMVDGVLEKTITFSMIRNGR